MLGLIILLQMLLAVLYFGKIGAITVGVSMTILAFMYVWVSRHSLKDKYIELTRNEIPWLYDSIVKMANKAGIRIPHVYILDDYIPNAYSFGSSIVLSVGLFEVLDREEILGVAAHELGHIKNKDTLFFPMVVYGRYLMILLAVMIILFSHNLFLKVLSIAFYILYEMERIEFFKDREFKADETAVRLLDRPLSLKDALEELKYYEDLRTHVKDSALPGIEPSIERKPKKSFMDTHPTYDERILRIILESEGINIRNILK